MPVPEISRFLGMVIQMFFDDHPPPHFHVRYGDSKARIRIDPVGLLAGSLSPRALALAIEWASLHREELLENWRRLRAREAATRIPPLE
jgi:hypothetical protein